MRLSRTELDDCYGACMSEFEKVTVWTGIASVAVNLILFGMVVLQLWISRRVTRGDNARRKKQATIDFWSLTQDRRLKLADRLPLDTDLAGIAEFVATIGQDDSGNVRTLTDLLGLYELLAAGINAEVLDLELFARIAGPRITSVTEGYGEWILERRSLLNHPLLYDELTTLSETLTKRISGGLPY
jgi:hypothetical protein